MPFDIGEMKVGDGFVTVPNCSTFVVLPRTEDAKIFVAIGNFPSPPVASLELPSFEAALMLSSKIALAAREMWPNQMKALEIKVGLSFDPPKGQAS